jgi:hypothetical protein
MSIPTLKIAGVEFSLQTFAANQSYRPIGGSPLHRKLNGARAKQTHRSKLGTTISGGGGAPAAPAAGGGAAGGGIYCIEPRAIHSASTSATLPAARRSDLAVNVLAYAVVAGELVATAVSMATDTATATAVSGATSYQFYYYPKLNFYSSGPAESLDMERAVYSWSIEAEEA